MKRSLCFTMIMVLILSTLAGCTGSSNSSTTTTSPSPASQSSVQTTSTPPSGNPVSGSPVSSRDTYRMGLFAEPTTMDPADSKDKVTWMIVMQSYDTLIAYDVPSGQFIPALASSWSISEDSREVTFEIRQDVFFHNGDPMTTDDVLWSLQRALESSFTNQLTGPMERFEKTDGTHVKLLLKYPYAPILEAMVTPCFSVVSRSAAESAAAAGQDFGRMTCGTGAYQLKEWKSGEKMIFESYDSYYNGAPAIKNVEVIFIPDASSGSIALEDGSIDHYLYLNQSDFQHLDNITTLQRIEAEGGVGLFDITFNVTDGIFTDKRLRQAVAYAVNREDMLLGGMEGYGQISNSFCATSSFGYMDDYPWYQRDIEKAKALMADAGYPNGFDVVFRQDAVPEYMKPAEIMQDQLRQIGINVTFEKLERATWTEQVAGNRDFVATLRMTTMVVNDADYILTRRFSSDNLGGANNYSGYQNPTLDALVEKARMLNGVQDRLDIYRQCYDILKEDVPFIPLYTDMWPVFINAKLKGFINHPQNRTAWSKLYFEG